jgi:DNA-binding transcriptional ArsR family regulator
VEPNPLQPNECARLLGALADPERLRIVQILRDGPHNVTEITTRLGPDSKMVNASHHLNVLRHAGLVEARKQGRFVYYSLAPGIYEIDEKGHLTDRLNLGCCQLQLPTPKSKEEE